MSSTPAEPDVRDILSNQPGSFAWTVFHDRHPKLLNTLRAMHPYGADQLRRLRDLEAETTEGPIQTLPPGAHDEEQWAEWGRPFFGQSWFDVPFLWAESYFYRRLLDALGFFAPGPWQRVDPFHLMKSAELTGLSIESQQDRRTLLLAALWGNRADLGFRITHDTDTEAVAALLADDSDAIWRHLGANPTATISYVADNAGQELVADLLLIDHLLTSEAARRVRLHVKPVPYYVSDATAADVVCCLDALASSKPAGTAVAQRMRTAASNGRFVLATHWFWASPLTFHDLPAELVEDLAASSVTILKGDLNYRRLVGDVTWPTTEPFIDVVKYFPGSVAALRTLKSDVVVGLEPGTEQRLTSTDPNWRTSGTHALIQFRS
jgi:hypothetical protein